MPSNMHYTNILVKNNIREAVLRLAVLPSMIAHMRLAKIRRAKGLTQIQMAEMVGVTQPTISRAERGDYGIPIGTYKACADALGISLADLFSDDRTSAQEAILAAFDRLPPARQQAWLAMAELAQKEAAIEAAQNDPAAEKQ